MTTTDANAALRHARLRWVGVPLFFCGVVGLVITIALVVLTEARWNGIMLYVATTGLSLAVFGLNNDTALAYAHRAPRDALPRELSDELDAEAARDRQDLAKLAPSPRAAMVMTLIALSLHIAGLRWLILHS